MFQKIRDERFCELFILGFWFEFYALAGSASDKGLGFTEATYLRIFLDDKSRTPATISIARSTSVKEL